jgi:hypothetical protein
MEPQQPNHRITVEDATLIADHMVDNLVKRLSDEKTVDLLLAVWSSKLDRHIGRAVRRGLFLILAALALVIGLKIEAVIAWIRSIH